MILPCSLVKRSRSDDAHEEAAGAAGGVADDVGGLRLDEIDHQADDVARGAELAVDAGRGELAEQVFVEVALGVAGGQRAGRRSC